MSSSQTYSPFRSVLLREWRRMTSRRLYFGVCIILPLFTLFFMATIFGNGQMENIPIGIVDQDNTASSRAIARNISAVPTFKVTRHFVNEEAARKAVQKKEIYGYLSIPPKFEQDAISGKNAVATTVHTTQNNIAVSDAGLQEAKVRLDNAEREYHRYKNLLAQDAVTKQQYDAVQTDYEASKARYELLLRQRQSTTLVKQEQTHRLEQTDAGIKLAQAALELARLNLSYTVILAPCDGTTGRKDIQEGQLIQPGQTLVDIVDENERWVVANYKETQTTYIREGQPVEIEVDAVPGIIFKGIVKSISRATGASFSLLPQDNSAGNFVKVEQRVPIRIEFSTGNRPEDMERLRAGMNVECVVNY